MGGRPEGFDGLRGIEIERPEGKIDPVAPQVGHRAAAEIPPPIPLRPRPVGLMAGALRGGAEPQIPVEPFRDRRRADGAILDGDDVAILLRILRRLQPPRPADPAVDVAHLPDRPPLHELHDAPVVGVGMNLRPHLRGDAGQLGCLGDDAGLADVVRQRLFAVDVLLLAKRRQRREGVGVFGGADDDGVIVGGLELLVEPAVVAESLGAGRLAEGAGERLGVDVTHRHHLLAEDGVEVAAATAAAADHRHPQLLRPVLSANNRRQAEDGAGGDRAPEKRPPAPARPVDGRAGRRDRKLGGNGLGAHGRAPAGERGIGRSIDRLDRGCLETATFSGDVTGGRSGASALRGARVGGDTRSKHRLTAAHKRAR